MAITLRRNAENISFSASHFNFLHSKKFIFNEKNLAYGRRRNYGGCLLENQRDESD